MLIYVYRIGNKIDGKKTTIWRMRTLNPSTSKESRSADWPPIGFHIAVDLSQQHKRMGQSRTSNVYEIDTARQIKEDTRTPGR